MNVNSIGEGPAQWRSAFSTAAVWFADVAPDVVRRLDDPGLGEWTLRDLLGHTTRSLITTEEYLTDDTTGTVDIPTAGAYLVAVHDVVDHAAVAERGRAAGEALGDDPLAFVNALVSRVPLLVEAAPDEARMRTPFGTMVLAEYAVSRTFELVVHTGDLLRAIGRSDPPPEAPGRSALRLVSDALAARGLAGDVLSALTGRTELAPGFSAL